MTCKIKVARHTKFVKMQGLYDLNYAIESTEKYNRCRKFKNGNTYFYCDNLQIAREIIINAWQFLQEFYSPGMCDYLNDSKERIEFHGAYALIIF